MDTTITDTDKWTCRELAALLPAYGVEEAVICPGTRNAPITMAFSRCGSLKLTSVVDERSAAFIALGKASVSRRPVAVVCTSGTALLNFAPAVAEAYYRHVPLIVISADRPQEWIDQDDSQTIRQPEALREFTLRRYHLDGNPLTGLAQWHVNRMICEGMLAATGHCQGPVHFNVAIGEPIPSSADVLPLSPRIISRIDSAGDISTDTAQQLASELRGKRIMIVAGFLPPDATLHRALVRLSAIPSVTILAEQTANLNDPRFINVVDETLFLHPGADDLRPDVIISFGGSLVSATLKNFLRKSEAEHWLVGFYPDDAPDCFMSLTRVIGASPALFFRRLASAMQPLASVPSDFAQSWRLFSSKATDAAAAALPGEWCDLTAVRTVISHIPRKYNLQLSNGMTLRYALMQTMHGLHSVDCNRGVSGIDGSVSTAVGASTAYPGTTLLITGDMSAQYDMAAFYSGLLTPRFKVIVIANGDGGIFRVIRNTRHLPEMEPYLAATVRFPARQIAESAGITFFEASSIQELTAVLPRFFAESESPAMLVILTSSADSAAITREFYKRLKKHNNIP